MSNEKTCDECPEIAEFRIITHDNRHYFCSVHRDVFIEKGTVWVAIDNLKLQREKTQPEDDRKLMDDKEIVPTLNHIWNHHKAIMIRWLRECLRVNLNEIDWEFDPNQLIGVKRNIDLEPTRQGGE